MKRFLWMMAVIIGMGGMGGVGASLGATKAVAGEGVPDSVLVAYNDTAFSNFDMFVTALELTRENSADADISEGAKKNRAQEDTKEETYRSSGGHLKPLDTKP
ncbi:MAG TPA: hypothetical protein DDW94_08525 [Deltaproteobacteria bacterium]|nr:MAG: hypothetical protein A2Z79_03040 [Deltaproteobacteria bacterium GWA2_55_82]OGQ62259.1 MAG: hypothetical protein A3I81_04950 [Deltaproteobacteria bacterium RIFCSPLOWO2_02_FULL_55_12]OIJ74370.1 MAG: hypothetical protein A2V21_308940 [Deltaproteobacteria bacterium GWC2_55_46]HBG47018.1 hypothetical protein [Deltaproteobacteria bacterium]